MPGRFEPSIIKNPAIANKDTARLQSPLRCVLSAYQPTAIVNTTAAVYDGTDSRFTCVGVCTILSSWTMVGKNSEKAYKLSSAATINCHV